MKLIIEKLLFVAILCFTQILNAQQGWENQNSGTSLDLYSIQFANSQIGWFVGFDGAIFKTSDLGNNWIPQQGFIGQMYFSLSLVDSANAIAIGSSGLISKTTNGGFTWVHNSLVGSHLYSVSFTDLNKIHVCGTDGRVVDSYDGGLTWTEHIFGNAQFWSIVFTDTLNGWSGGDNRIVHTSDGGKNWAVQLYGQNFLGIRNLFFVNDTLGWGVGLGGFVLNTKDGGVSWNEQNSNTSRHLLSVFFINKSIGWAVGSFGTIIKTTDGGENWYSQESGTIEDLNSVYFSSVDTGFVCGMNGTLLFTTNGGGATSSLYNNINQKMEYTISQNFPNPFNPSTTISYQLPKTGNVTIKVFDVLAREVATLVNEEKPAGSYNVKFNGSALASGIYYYQIKAGEFIQTKKMILLK